MNKNDLVRLRHMLDAAQTALTFAKDRSKSELETDQMFAFAVVRAIEIVGEAASNVSEETRQEYPDIAWKGIRGMRNRIIHGYFDIDYDIVWETVTLRLPDLILALEKIIPPEG